MRAFPRPVKMCIPSSSCTTIPLALLEVDFAKLSLGRPPKSAIQKPKAPVCKNFRRGPSVLFIAQNFGYQNDSCLIIRPIVSVAAQKTPCIFSLFQLVFPLCTDIIFVALDLNALRHSFFSCYAFRYRFSVCV